MANPEELDVPRLLAERERSAAALRDGRRSPYAAVARHDLLEGRPIVLGSADECEVQLEGLRPRHARLAVQGEEFRLEALDPEAALQGGARELRAGPGAKVQLGRYVLRLSHQNFPAVLVLDPQSPRLQQGPAPRWFPPDPGYRLRARLQREEHPREESVLSTRGNRRRALRLGWLTAQVPTGPVRLLALRLQEPGVGEAAVSIFFRDATTGGESYPVGRYLEPEPVPGSPDEYVLDFNRAYNPTCAFSEHYNCPLPPRENTLPIAIRAGELDPGHHAAG